MKIRLFSLLSLLCAAGIVSFTSCSDDDNGDDQEVTEGVFVLNEGSFNGNNAGLSYYNVDTKIVSPDVFLTQNGKGMGDTGQDVIIYGSKMYVTVYSSNVIWVLDKKGVAVKSISTIADGQPQSPRYMAAHGGKVYVTLFDGHIARIDTTTLTIEKQVKVGDNPEQIVAVNGKLYVANSGGMVAWPPVSKTVSVIDINSFSETKKIDVQINPVKLVTDKKGNVYCISMGDYGKIENMIYRIDAGTDAVKELANATLVTSTGDKLYWIYAQYGAPEIKFVQYDAVNEKVITENFITDGTKIADPNSLNVDPVTGNIYIGNRNKSNNGDMYVFSDKGVLLDKFEVGIGPNKAVFVTK